MVALSGCSHHGMCYLLKLAMKSSTSCLVKVQEDINISVGPAMKPSFAHAVGAQGSSHLTQSHFSMVVLKAMQRPKQHVHKTTMPRRCGTFDQSSPQAFYSLLALHHHHRQMRGRTRSNRRKSAAKMDYERKKTRSSERSTAGV